MFKKSSFFIKDLLSAPSTLHQSQNEGRMSPLNRDPTICSFKMKTLSQDFPQEPLENFASEILPGFLSAAEVELTKSRSHLQEKRILDLTMKKDSRREFRERLIFPYSGNDKLSKESSNSADSKQNIMHKRSSVHSPSSGSLYSSFFPPEPAAQPSILSCPKNEYNSLSPHIISPPLTLSQLHSPSLSPQQSNPLCSSRSSTPDSPIIFSTRSLFTFPSSTIPQQHFAHFSDNANLLPAAAAALSIHHQNDYEFFLREHFNNTDQMKQRQRNLLAAKYSSLFSSLPVQDYRISSLSSTGDAGRVVAEEAFSHVTSPKTDVNHVPSTDGALPVPVFIRPRTLVLPDTSSKKSRRSRTVFTELQLMGLERRFETQKYLSTPDRVDLAKSLGLSQLQVKTWYQNRRMKWKKQVMQDGCKEAPTKPKGRPKKNSVPSYAELQRMQAIHEEERITKDEGGKGTEEITEKEDGKERLEKDETTISFSEEEDQEKYGAEKGTLRDEEEISHENTFSGQE